MTLTAETRTEYAVKSTQTRHGKRQIVIETTPGHESDRAWNEQRVEGEREWQASVGLTPDAELVSRTVTVTEWVTFTPLQAIDAAEAIRAVTSPLFEGRISGRDRKALTRFAAWPGLSKETAKVADMVLDGTILLPMEDAWAVALFQALSELPKVSEDELEAWTPDWETAPETAEGATSR